MVAIEDTDGQQDPALPPAARSAAHSDRDPEIDPATRQRDQLGFHPDHGELKKLGAKGVSRTTVIDILKEEGIPTAPNRDESTWYQFLKMHGSTLWACDFASKRVLSRRGLKMAFVLIFVNIQTRRAYVSPSTIKPDAA